MIKVLTDFRDFDFDSLVFWFANKYAYFIQTKVNKWTCGHCPQKLSVIAKM